MCSVKATVQAVNDGEVWLATSEGEAIRLPLSKSKDELTKDYPVDSEHRIGAGVLRKYAPELYKPT